MCMLPVTSSLSPPPPPSSQPPCSCQCKAEDLPNSPTLDHHISILTPFLDKPEAKEAESLPPPPSPPTKPSNSSKNESVDNINNSKTTKAKPQQHQKHGSSSSTFFFQEARSILSLSLPMVLTGLVLYSRSMLSMLFLGRLGDLPLAGGSLAIGFANITGYSVLSGLAMGMEPLCSQAFGARRPKLLGLALQRTVLLLLTFSVPIAFLWLNMAPLLLYSGQDPAISAAAHTYILHSLPDLVLQSFLHPLRIYLRSQSITMPLTYCALLSLALHLPINYLLVCVLDLGIAGVALSAVWTNLNLVASLLFYVYYLSGGIHRATGGLRFSSESFKGWGSLLSLALPSCASVCLEWWWYEIMILLCGLLANPKATVASMGVAIQTTALMYIFPSSLSFGVSTRVGNELGANRPERARRAAFVGLGCGFLLGLSSLCFAVSVRNVWAGMFTSDAEILRLTAAALPIIGLCELGNCPQTTGCGVLRGSARPRAGANINLASFYAVGMPVAVGLGFYAGLDFVGLWMGLLAAQGTCVVAMLAVIRRTDWESQADRAQKLVGGLVVVVPDVVDLDKRAHDGRQEGATAAAAAESESLLQSIKIEAP